MQFKKIALFYDIYSRKTQFIKPRFGRKNLALLDNFIIHYDLIYYMNQFNECDWLIYQFESWVRVLSLSEFLNRIFILF